MQSSSNSWWALQDSMVTALLGMPSSAGQQVQQRQKPPALAVDDGGMHAASGLRCCQFIIDAPSLEAIPWTANTALVAAGSGYLQLLCQLHLLALGHFSLADTEPSPAAVSVCVEGEDGPAGLLLLSADFGSLS